MRKLFTVFILASFCFAACSGKQNATKTTANPTADKSQAKAANPIKLVQPKGEMTIKEGDAFTIEYALQDNNIQIDSATIALNGKYATSFTGTTVSFKPEKPLMGRQSLSVTGYANGKAVGSLSYSFIIVPNTSPKLYTYRVLKEYPHRTDAYTQGLYFYKGDMYESTGQYGQSTLRKVNYKTGEVLKNISLDPKYFGEGACELNNKVYQLTWQEKTGFIYDATTLEQTGTFNYGTEGWGITTNGKELIMSDGTHRLFFIDPQNMAITKRLEVYSDAGAVHYVNELEFIDGEIWANVYTEDIIIRINPDNGMVTGLIHMNNLLKASERKPGTDVLNGIAYEPSLRAIYVTGKNWPKLFHVEIVEK